MAVKPADALQQQVHRRQIRDQQVGIDIEGLLRHLGRHQHQPARPARPRAWPVLTMGPQQLEARRSAVRAVRDRHPPVQQPHVPTEPPLRELRVERLRPRDRVADDQRTATLRQPFLEQVGHRLITRRLLGQALLARAVPRGLGEDLDPHSEILAPRTGVIHKGPRPPGTEPGRRHTRITRWYGQVRARVLLARRGPRQIRLHQLAPLPRRKRRGQQHHRHPGLPEPAQRLLEELRHVDVRRVHLVQHHHLAGQTRHPQHHVLGARRREEQLVDGADHERAQQPATTAQKPQGRRLPHRPLRGAGPRTVRVMAAGHAELIHAVEPAVRLPTRRLQQRLPLLV